ncbi:MAG TPA: DUF167 family protein [Hyphomicrobiaceae bacterium]|nr:DUF167 family protein [Hyphomicrobiaceae bacterium]
MAKAAWRTGVPTAPGGAPTCPWRQGDGCVIVRVRVTPKSSKTKVDGVGETADGPAVLARVASVPENGAANAALEELIARWLDLPRRSATVVAGHRSRLKSVAIAGEEVAIQARLAAAIGAFGTAAD